MSSTIDDVRLKSNLKTYQTLTFTEKSLFYTILVFTRSRFYPMISIGLEQVYNSILNKTEDNNKFELYNFLMKNLLVFLTQKSEMILKDIWIFQVLELSIYKMI